MVHWKWEAVKLLLRQKNKMPTPTLDEYGTDLTTLANKVLFWTY